jgi:hypothetical protein
MTRAKSPKEIYTMLQSSQDKPEGKKLRIPELAR